MTINPINNKPTIEQALANKLPLPWKTQGQTGPIWAVKRQRPEDLTGLLFNRLEAYGMKRATIRELFYIMSVDFSSMLKKLGIGKGKPGGKRKEPKSVIQPKPFRVNNCERPGYLKVDKYDNPIAVAEPAAADPVDANTNGRNYQSRHFLGLDETGITIPDVSTWAEFTGKPTGCNTGGDILSVGKKIHIGSKASTVLAGWERCAILVSPDIKKVALRKSSTGVKIQKPKNCSGAELSCKAATDKITASYPAPRQYRLQDATPELVIFALEQ